jgi:hypothetical protein
MTTGTYIPTEVCDQGIADNLGIPAAYLRRLREHKPGLYDANVNAWLDGDDRRFLLRCLRPASGDGPGAARAFLSDGYKIIDKLDVLLAVLDGVRQASAPVQVDGCDLTARRMYVRVICEQVRVLAPALLAGYRSPFTGASGADNPVVFAGFAITNSETRCGAFTLTPRLVVQVCRNGLTIARDAMRAVHLGEPLDEGMVTWSDNTRDKTLALITAKTTDAVAAYLDPSYAQRALAAIEKDAGRPMADPQEAIRTVSQRLRFTDTQQRERAVVRGTKRKAIRVEPELWREYGLAIEALGTDRSKDLRAHMLRRVRAWKRHRSAPSPLLASDPLTFRLRPAGHSAPVPGERARPHQPSRWSRCHSPAVRRERRESTARTPGQRPAARRPRWSGQR